MAEVLAYGARGRWPVSLRGWLATGFAGLAGLHFAFSVFGWSLSIYSSVRNPRVGLNDLTYFVPTAGPCALLFLLSCCATWLAVKRRRTAPAVLLLLIALSAGLFYYDTSRRRYQIEVSIATKEYWDSGGAEHVYITWWWYNDRWFSR